MKVWGGNQSIDSGIALPGVDVWVFSQPFKGSGQGGDIYYTSLCGKGMLSRFVVTDVFSHGASAGELAKKLRDLMHKHFNTLDQSGFAHALNEEFSNIASTGKCAMAVLTRPQPAMPCPHTPATSSRAEVKPCSCFITTRSIRSDWKSDFRVKL